MNTTVRLVLQLLGAVVLAAPLSIAATLLLIPFWSFLEAATGVEAVGHSGPAEWCYVAVYGAVLCAGAAWIVLRRRR